MISSKYLIYKCWKNDEKEDFNELLSMKNIDLYSISGTWNDIHDVIFKSFMCFENYDLL